MNTDFKKIFLIVTGNILDYYDFLLFAHLGSIITSTFFNCGDHANLISLLLFSVPFFSRPFGGYIFGKIADSKGQINALIRSLNYSSIATLAIALLPSYEILGLASSFFFLILRAIQGFSLGGEYTTAGIYLIENNKNKKYFISGLLSASGTIGSLLAFFVYFLYFKSIISGQDWRFAFFLAYVGTYISFKIRKIYFQKHGQNFKDTKENHVENLFLRCFLIFLLASLISTLCWLCMIYTNYYFTKILNLSTKHGLIATFIALITYVFCNIIFGYLSDFFKIKNLMKNCIYIIIPFSTIGFYFINNGIIYGQFFLSIAASFGYFIHVFMSQVIPKTNKNRNINTSFSIGTAIGGIIPFISGFFLNNFNVYYTPMFFIGIISLLILYCYKKMGSITN